MKIFYLIAILFTCTCLECNGQTAVSNWTRKFEFYQSIWPKTKLHLIFNQNKFSPGDTLWFKAYFLKEDLTAVKGKQLVDLNLVDSAGESKLHFLFPIIDGQGQNQVVIPVSLSAGVYQLNAYSSWMKNFGSKSIFSREITIVKDNQVKVDQNQNMIVAIEGKHLIREVSNKIVISGEAGTGVRIVDANDLQIGVATTDKNGLASIVFTPKTNTSYFVKTSGNETSVSLPRVEDDGCAIMLTPATKVGEPIKMILTSPSGSPLRNEELTVIVSSKGKIYYTEAFSQGEKAFVELSIPCEKLPDGVSQLSLLNRSGGLVASRDFFNTVDGSVQSQLQVLKTSFLTREKVRAEINLMNDKGQPVDGEFTIRVTNEGLFGNNKQNSFSDELNLPSYEGNKFVVDRSVSNWMESLDNFLILSSEELPWKEIMKNESKPTYQFNNVVQKRGSVYFSDTSLPVPELTQLTFYLQHNQSVYHTFVDKGKVWLTMPDVFGEDEVFYLAESKRKQIPNVKIVWEDEPAPKTNAVVFREEQTPDVYGEFSKKKRLMDHSYGFYSANKREPALNKKSNTDFEDEIMGADVTINIQDYILFPNMEELIKEVIPPMYHRKFGERDIVRVKLPEPMNSNITGDAIFVIDGIATNNTAFFLSLKPADLLTIKVVRDPVKLSRFGLMGKNGIVIVQTKNGNVREPIDPSRIIEGINKSLDFRNSNYAVENDIHRPDFRSTLFWNPVIKTNSKGKAIVEFYCSDDIGKFQIRIDGMTTTAKPFSTEQEIEVTLSAEKN